MTTTTIAVDDVFLIVVQPFFCTQFPFRYLIGDNLFLLLNVRCELVSDLRILVQKSGYQPDPDANYECKYEEKF